MRLGCVNEGWQRISELGELGAFDNVRNLKGEINLAV